MAEGKELDAILDSLVRGKSPEEIFGDSGLVKELTKRLVELHHGKIKIESTKGVGTKVTVRLTSDPAVLD